MNDYTSFRAFAAEGARVGLITCLRCGAAILIDPGDDIDARVLHDDWHRDVRLFGGPT